MQDVAKRSGAATKRSAFEQVRGKQSKLGSKERQKSKEGIKQQEKHQAANREKLAIERKTEDQWSPKKHPVGEDGHVP